MYYHPLMLPNMSGERALRTCRAISDVWFDGIDRHRAAQSDAAKSFCSAQLENARRLAETENGTQFAVRLLSYMAVEPLRFVALASELGEIAIDAHRQTLKLLSPHGEASMAASDAEVDSEPAHARSTNPRASGRRLQVMA